MLQICQQLILTERSDTFKAGKNNSPITTKVILSFLFLASANDTLFDHLSQNLIKDRDGTI